MKNDLIELTKQLVRIPSITPDDANCQEILINYLTNLGFTITRLPFGKVNNFWAQYGTASPLFAFAGHTDVVACGPLEKWQCSPFLPEVIDNKLYGRGTADMKGSLAAMLVACKEFLTTNSNIQGSIGFLITSGEEGDDFEDGTPKVMEYLKQQGIHIDYCVLGEPSSEHQVGDMIKVGRRGSLTGKAIIHGIQGHVAYPHLAANPIHYAAPLLTALAQKNWDQGNEFFPPTTFQITNMNAGTGAGNVIPGHLSMEFNFRYSSEITHLQLQEEIQSLFQHFLGDDISINYEIHWRLNGEPFFTAPGILSAAVCKAIQTIADKTPVLSTTGGTSDGRFIVPYGVQLIELGLVNKTIHQINEHIVCDDLLILCRIYQEIMKNLLVS